MELQNRISLRALKVWRQTGFIVSTCMLVAAIAVTIVRHIFDGPLWLVYSSWGVVVLSYLLLVFLIPSLRWKWWRYEVREEEIEIQKGLFIITRTLVPMVRVQHVDTKQGPMLRKNNLASVEISTAATVHEIPALDYEEAERLRVFIVEMIRTVKDDV